MRTLGFVLELAAILAVFGAGASLLTWPLLVLLERFGKGPRAAVRAELSFLVGALPAAVSLGVVTAVMAPSLLASLTGTADHCGAHSHHLHLCVVHPAAVRPAVAAIGATALAVFGARLFSLWGRWRTESQAMRALEALGSEGPARAFPVQVVPATGWWCFAAGALRRRIVLSEPVVRGLAPAELEAALSHEEAHLRRHDPLAQRLLAMAGLLSLPFASARAQACFRAAAEEASDAAAALKVRDGAVVARALVKVAGGPAWSGAFSFGEHPLERRVQRLLSGVASDARVHSRVMLAGVGLGLGAVGLALLTAAELHHGVETALHHLF